VSDAQVAASAQYISPIFFKPASCIRTNLSGPEGTGALARQIVEDPESPGDLRALAAQRARMADKPVLINADPPSHLRQRKLVNRAFTRKRVAGLETSIEALADKLIDAFIGDGRVEFRTQFAGPLPMRMIARVLGVPEDLMDTFRTWSEAITGGVGVVGSSDNRVRTMFQDMDEFFQYFGQQLEERRAAPRDDLLTDLLSAGDEDDRPLDDDEMLAMLAQFLTAGNETTTNLLASCALRLATEPTLADRLRSAPNEVPEFVEELLRLEAPAQGLFRTALTDVVIEGVPVPAGSFVWLAYGSANRDADEFAEPDVLDLGRPDKLRHLAFGQGEHFCLDAPLARLEAKVSITALLRRLKDITLDEPAEHVEYRPSYIMHAPARIRLRFVAST
jgi:cytochrome P450